MAWTAPTAESEDFSSNPAAPPRQDSNGHQLQQAGSGHRCRLVPQDGWLASARHQPGPSALGVPLRPETPGGSGLIPLARRGSSAQFQPQIFLPSLRR
eukprot:CAMPEP_0204503562 /NCGR_PEP_ID=MMETSP0471-20130131/103732_1 /ASSEMBLY_ACC=CAM_ASM_000602 /TAXON_ID=2969 /ORGANISM="Oxyrrhis marina" /LENGTH=97 /DNA_ID=CAMNT_0051508381 /DNA_START=40 /DNA_END=329 /DNA_ORIENTATION=-